MADPTTLTAGVTLRGIVPPAEARERARQHWLRLKARAEEMLARPEGGVTYWNGAKQLHPECEDPRPEPVSDAYTRVYVPAGKVTHLVPGTVNGRTPSAACGLMPHWADSWLGTGAQAEIDKALTMRLCRYCRDKARAVSADA